jgi:hypothetical protein
LPDGVQCDKYPSSIKVVPGGRQVIQVNVRRNASGTWLRDKNLFKASMTAHFENIATAAFGLGGARQWLVYGPYWDMWDKTKNEVCPYQNEQVCCNPSALGYNDYYNHHVRADHPYLDESVLLERDLPEELPLALEVGEDLITDRDLGGFKGQACYYFVRTFQSAGLIGETELDLGRTGPCRVWLDGRQIVHFDNMRSWAPDEGIKCTLTGRPQRLVVKFIRLTDAMSFSLTFVGQGDPTHRRGISRFADFMEDLPPAAGDRE